MSAEVITLINEIFPPFPEVAEVSFTSTPLAIIALVDPLRCMFLMVVVPYALRPSFPTDTAVPPF